MVWGFYIWGVLLKNGEESWKEIVVLLNCDKIPSAIFFEVYVNAFINVS